MKYRIIPVILGIYISCMPLKHNSNYKVKRVIDGDTIVLDNNERVRLIGINSPELKERCGSESKKKLEELIKDSITLEKDVSERDRYNRLLRYLYSKDIFINLEMINTGYAKNYPYPPDIKYEQRFKQAEKEAKLNKRGCLWK